MTARSLPTTAPGSRTAGRAAAGDLRLGGSLLFLAGAVILMGIVTAEALYPEAYSTAANTISDLAGARPPDGVVHQPSAAIFDLSMIVAGLLVLVGSRFVHRAYGRRSVTIPIAILGAAALGVGLFPETAGTPHTICALATFASGGIAAIAAARLTAAPFRYLSSLLGAAALVTLVSSLVLGDASPIAGLGVGGLERWVAYPELLWVAGFGGYLAGRGDVEATPSAAGTA